MRLSAGFFFLALCFLQFGCSWSIECTTSPHSRFSDQTEYNISDTLRVPDVNEPDCTFTWSDNGTVIADHRSKDPKLVVEYSINYLITPKCSDNISFKRMCSEGIGYLSHCAINCTLRALQRSQEQREIDAGPGVAVNRGAGAAVAAGVFLLAIVLICVFCKFKKYFSSWNPPRWIVCLKNSDPKTSEREASNRKTLCFSRV